MKEFIKKNWFILLVILYQSYSVYEKIQMENYKWAFDEFTISILFIVHFVSLGNSEKLVKELEIAIKIKDEK